MVARRELTLGVDLGTSTCSAGVYDRNQVQLVGGEGCAVPSIVHVPTHGDPLIGGDAQHRTVFSPSSSVTSVKRLLGAQPGDLVIRRHAALAPAPFVTGTGGRLGVILDAGKFTIEQVVSLLLGKLRRGAEKRFGASIRHMVVVVPATVTESYERALTRAAALAKLKIVEMIPEPVAGALGLGLHLEQGQRRLLVCDFGGGFFDVAAIIAGSGRLDVLATSGDPNLGGDDFTDSLLEGLADEEFGHGLFDVIAQAGRYRKFSLRLELLKRLLSEQMEASVRARDVVSVAGSPADIDRAVARRWAESRWSRLIERAIMVSEKTLEHVGWSPGELDGVVLLGGVSQTPIVRLQFESTFGTLVASGARAAATAVVRGAVLRSSQYAGARARRATRRPMPPPPPREPEIPYVVEPNMAATARIRPIRL